MEYLVKCRRRGVVETNIHILECCKVFSTLAEFHDEVENKLTKGLDWKIGRNLEAFNDVLTGGFGVHEYDEEIEIKWVHFEKSKADLGDLFDTIINIIRGHEHIELRIE